MMRGALLNIIVSPAAIEKDVRDKGVQGLLGTVRSGLRILRVESSRSGVTAYGSREQRTGRQ